MAMQGFAPGGVGGQGTSQGSAPGAIQTFSQLQKQGVARPASPAYQPAAPKPPQSAGQQMYGKPVNPTGFSPQQPASTPQTGTGTQAGGGYAGPTVQNPLPMTAGQGMPTQSYPVAQQQFHNTPTAGNTMNQAAPGLTPFTGQPNVMYTNNVLPPGQNVDGSTIPGSQGSALPQQTAGQAQNQNWGQTGQQLYDQWQQSQHQIGANPFQYNNPINQQLGATVSQHLANPSAYTSQMVQNTYNDLNRNLGQGYDYQRQQLQEMMARRGFDASTLHGQKYSDLGTEQARSQADLVHQLTSDAARQYGTDLNGAISSAMGYGAQDYGQAQGTYQTNQAAQQQQYNQNQQNFQNYVGFGQQDFNNQMDVNNFNANRDDAMNQWLLALMGGIGG